MSESLKRGFQTEMEILVVVVGVVVSLICRLFVEEGLLLNGVSVSASVSLASFGVLPILGRNELTRNQLYFIAVAADRRS